MGFARILRNFRRLRWWSRVFMGEGKKGFVGIYFCQRNFFTGPLRATIFYFFSILFTYLTPSYNTITSLSEIPNRNMTTQFAIFSPKWNWSTLLGRVSAPTSNHRQCIFASTLFQVNPLTITFSIRHILTPI